MPHGTTRSSVSCLVTYSLPSGMMRSEFNELVMIFVLNDPERLNKLLGDVVISQGGVVPHINPEVCSAVDAQLDIINLGYLASSEQIFEGQEGESGSIDT